MRKQIYLTAILYIICSAVFAQKDSLDVFYYQQPEFFTKSEFPSRVEYSLQNKDGSFCTITIYKSSLSEGDTLKTIMQQWNDQVFNILTKADKEPARIMTGKSVDGWASSVAIGNYFQNEKKAIVMLNSFKTGKTAACVVFTCSDKSFKLPIDEFSKNLHLKKL
jgi:hypothetical protein